MKSGLIIRSLFVFVTSLSTLGGLFTNSALAQTTMSGIQGRVTDAVSGAPLEGAQIMVSSSAKKNIAEVHSDVSAGKDGTYSVGSLPAGTYSVTVTYPGYAPASKSDILTAEGAAAGLDFQLRK